MKICVVGVPGIDPGAVRVKDSRLDELHKLAGSKKKTYYEVTLAGVDEIKDADAILARATDRADLILKDLEFVETRLGRCEDDGEKALLERLRQALEQESLLSTVSLSEEERKLVSGYGLLTVKPIVFAQEGESDNRDALLAKTVAAANFISFFTTGERETRAWLIRKGTTAWEAAGVIHSDIQRGFIRAEVMTCDDVLSAGSVTAVKQAGKMRLEQKDYSVQDAEVMLFRFNK